MLFRSSRPCKKGRTSSLHVLTGSPTTGQERIHEYEKASPQRDAQLANMPFFLVNSGSIPVNVVFAVTQNNSAVLVERGGVLLRRMGYGGCVAAGGPRPMLPGRLQPSLRARTVDIVSYFGNPCSNVGYL